MPNNKELKSRAERIAKQIMESERFRSSSLFEDRVFSDEPILRTGTAALANREAVKTSHTSRVTFGMPAHSSPTTTTPREIPAPMSDPVADSPFVPARPRKRKRAASSNVASKRIRRMRRLARNHGGSYAYYRPLRSNKLFFEQAKFMEDFEDDFGGTPRYMYDEVTYEELSEHDLRCYFTWRAKVRKGTFLSAPGAFVYLYANELLCGVGAGEGMDAYQMLEQIGDAYQGTSPSLDAHIARWKRDYVLYFGLDLALLEQAGKGGFYPSVVLLQQAEQALLAQDGPVTWPENSQEGLPAATDLLDALCALSRYRAERSRYVKAHREEVADVAAHVFSRMVAHCSKRRKTGYVEGLFGPAVRAYYVMFPGSLFWSPTPHEDVTYRVSDADVYECEHGYWYRDLPCRRAETSKELGNLLHAIDDRMRRTTGEKNLLKSRTLPKYQAKFVDEEIAAHLAREAAKEAARIHINKDALGSIRSAAVRTREALLTEDDLKDGPVIESVGAAPSAIKPATAEQAPSLQESSSVPHAGLLRALVEGESPSGYDDLQLSLAVDQINEAFLDILGDTVVEYDGSVPMLVPDYVDDVRDALGS